MKPANTNQDIRAQLAQDINDYLKKGGTITKVPKGEGKEAQEVKLNKNRTHVEKL